MEMKTPLAWRRELLGVTAVVRSWLLLDPCT